MAELLSSSDDESLGEEEPELPPPPPPTRDEAPSPEPSPPARTASRRHQEPEEELMESMFSPRKRKPPVSDELFPFTPSPVSNESSQEGDAEAARVQSHSKPVISASAMLLKFLPGKSTSVSTLKSQPTTQQLPLKRTLTMDDAKSGRGEEEDGSGWRKRAKPAEMSASERIALKYGLLPSKDTVGKATTTASATDSHSRGPGRRTSTSPSSSSPRERAQEPKPSRLTTKEAFWKSQGVDTEAVQDTRKDSRRASYVSPFASEREAKNSGGGGGSSFRSTRRRLDRLPPPVDKETFYTDDAQQPAPVNRPRHVIASKLTADAGDDNDEQEGGAGGDDGWLSDAKEIRSDDEQADSNDQRTSRVGGSTSRPRAQTQSRKRRRPGRVSADESEDDEPEIHSDVWPMLPPPKDTSIGPLPIQSATEGVADVEVCANINRYLFDYQREGVEFLFQAYAKRTGAILGDEMGLGKTIQVIALLSAILGKKGDIRDREAWRELRASRRQRRSSDIGVLSDTSQRNPILIVVPASLLHNWESELRVWMCCCSVILLGKPEEREQIIEQAGKGEYEIVICSYDVVKITLDKLKRVPWELIVFDEMHCLKNPDSQLTQAVKAIKCPRKIGLTGTLMQNNEKELHCLIDTIAPGVLGSWQEFRVYYGDDIKYGRKKSAAAEAVARSRKKEKELRDQLVPYYLRREKEINPCFQEVKKCDQVVFCDLTPYQLAAYKRILEMPEFELLRKGEEPCDCGRDSNRKRKECCYTTPAALGTDQRALLWERFHQDGEPCNSCPNCMGLVCMAQLLKLSNHMELLKVNPRDPPHLQEYQAAFAAKAFGNDVDAVGGVQQVSNFQEMRALGTQTCGKMLVLEKLLAVWKRKRQKTLLFSRSTRMLDILQLFLISKAVTYLRLDGQTKVDERLQLVNKFNDPESNISVFLISTRAGGLGLNLPTATNVVIFDPSWNPAHDCQAQDRAYRIGQTKDVQVYRLITLGTIEEMIYVRQIYKQQLSDTTLKGVQAPRYFEGVQGDRRQQGELFGIRNLLCWKEGGVLKDIQDAYRRDRDDVMIQENQVQYDQRRASLGGSPGKVSRRSKGNKHKQSELLDDVDAEMVEVADEMTSGMLNTTVNEPDDETTPKKTAASKTKREDNDSDNDGDTQSCFLQGARTLMHDHIVNEEDDEPYVGGDAFSETDEEEDAEEVAVVETKDPVVATPTKDAVAATTELILPAPSVAKAASPIVAAEPPRKSLYIPKYL